MYINGTAPQVVFTDTNQDSDYTIKNDGGQLLFIDRTNSNATRMYANTGGFGGDRLYIANDIVHTGDTDTRIEFGTDTINFDTAGSERLRIDSSGHISQGGGATPSSTNGNVGLKFGIKSALNNVIIGETTNGSMNGIILESRITGRSGGARCSQVIMGDGVINFETAPSGGAVTERLRITSDGKIGVGDNNPVVQFHVKGSGHSHGGLNAHASIEDTTSYAANVGGLQVFEGAYDSSNNPAIFSAIHGGKENGTDGNYAGYLRFLTRAHGALPVEVARLASIGFMGVKTPEPQTELNVIGTISTGRNVARELGTIINVSSNHSGTRVATNVINGVKEYEVGYDWLAAGNARVNANLTIELPQACLLYTSDAADE